VRKRLQHQQGCLSSVVRLLPVCIAKALLLVNAVASASDFVSVFSIATQAILTFALSLVVEHMY
jgi:hypothetical protein